VASTLEQMAGSPRRLAAELSDRQVRQIQAKPMIAPAFLGSLLENLAREEMEATGRWAGHLIHHPGHVFAGRGGPDFAHVGYEDSVFIDITTIDDAGPHRYARSYGRDMMLVLYSRPARLAESMIDAMDMLGYPFSAEQADELRTSFAITEERHRPYARRLQVVHDAWEAHERSQIQAKRERLLLERKVEAESDPRWRSRPLSAEEIVLFEEGHADLDEELRQLGVDPADCDDLVGRCLAALSECELDREVHEHLLRLATDLRESAVLEARSWTDHGQVIGQQASRDPIETVRDELAVKLEAIALVASASGVVDRRDMVDTCRHLRAVVGARNDVLRARAHEQLLVVLTEARRSAEDIDKDAGQLAERLERERRREERIIDWAQANLGSGAGGPSDREVRRSLGRARRAVVRAEAQLRFVTDLGSSNPELVPHQLAVAGPPLTSEETALVAQAQVGSIRDLLTSLDARMWEGPGDAGEDRDGPSGHGLPSAGDQAPAGADERRRQGGAGRRQDGGRGIEPPGP